MQHKNCPADNIGRAVCFIQTASSVENYGASLPLRTALPISFSAAGQRIVSDCDTAPCCCLC